MAQEPWSFRVHGKVLRRGDVVTLFTVRDDHPEMRAAVLGGEGDVLWIAGPDLLDFRGAISVAEIQCVLAITPAEDAIPLESGFRKDNMLETWPTGESEDYRGGVVFAAIDRRVFIRCENGKVIFGYAGLFKTAGAQMPVPA
jgi:hypothetical protein